MLYEMVGYQYLIHQMMYSKSMRSALREICSILCYTSKEDGYYDALLQKAELGASM